MTSGIITYLLRLTVLALIVLAYQKLPCVNIFVDQGISYLKSRDFEGLRFFILSYGVWAPITSILLMVLQSLFPLVPGLAITITIAWIFGWQWGAFYSWLGALLGATLDFGLARWYGRPLVEKIIRPQHLDLFDAFFLKHGIIAVFITRLTPVVPFKVVSYGAGLTKISLGQFIFGTGLGQSPAIILYSILGQNLVENLLATVLITVLLIIAGLTAYYYREALERLFFFNKDTS